MSDPERQSRLRQLPAMDRLLLLPATQPLLEQFPRAKVREALEGALASAREAILAGAEPPGEDSLVDAGKEILLAADRPRLVRAINATGIILHTGLGRAVLPGPAIDAVAREMRGYCVLAADRETGERFERDVPMAERLCALTGAEAATVVNNNAGATLLVLAALAKGKEVVVSRGQLVEIGGSFRLPSILDQAGARMMEIGTTNRTHLADYKKAITPETAILLRVHTANYRIEGFTAEVPTKEMADLAHAHGLLMVDDIGSGALFGLERWGLEHEYTAQESVRDGADVVLFSGDKLLGGPQCGIMVGRKKLIAAITKHPLHRALRMDKLRLCALEETLRLVANDERVDHTVPTYQMLARSPEDLRRQAEALAARLREAQPSLRVTAREDVTYVGSGSLPARAFPSWVVVVTSPSSSANTLARLLRLGDPPIYGRIHREEVILDLRTVLPGEDEEIIAVVSGLGQRAS